MVPKFVVFQPPKGWDVRIKSSNSNGRNDLTGTGSLPSTVPCFEIGKFSHVTVSMIC